MKLKKLFKDIAVQIKGNKDLEITGVSANSKLVAPGYLFVAKKGFKQHGARFIPEAMAAGALAVLTDIFDPTLKGITQIIHPDVSSLEGVLAARFFEGASEKLFMVGITGTNGKTTTSYIIKHLLEPCGLIGTIEYIIGNQRYQAIRTTPDVFTNHKLLRDMVLHSSTSSVMEVTSHALDQGRVAGIAFDIAVFTNLSLDHLDYHKSMEEYARVKNSLFSQLLKPTGVAIINADSSWKKEITKGCLAPIFTYGIENACDLQATDISLTPDGTTFTLNYLDETYACQTPFVGRYNVYNCLSAIAVALHHSMTLETIISKMRAFSSVPGRLERIDNALNLKVYVDFAHSDDALKNVFESLRELKRGRLITVFGCGGDRDATKRPKMASVCEEYSDLTIVTSDNPRSEDPEAIIEEIIQGFSRPDSYMVEVDRYQAITKAIECASAEDIILIAGKGHEKHQIFAHKTIEFDDCKVVKEITNQKSVARV